MYYTTAINTSILFILVIWVGFTTLSLLLTILNRSYGSIKDRIILLILYTISIFSFTVGIILFLKFCLKYG